MASDEYSLSEKIDNEMELFRNNINKYKAEVIGITEEMKQLIDKKSDELLKELDDVLKEVYEKKKKRSKVDQNFREIREHQKAMEDILSRMDPSFTLMTEVSEKIEIVKKEINTEIPNVKLIWNVDALKDSINNICSCEVEVVPDTPVAPKANPYRDKLEGSKRMDSICALRVIAYFEVNGRDVAISGSVLTTLTAKSGQSYYELHTDKPVHAQIRDREIKLKAPRITAIENSLFLISDQCIHENLVS